MTNQEQLKAIYFPVEKVKSHELFKGFSFDSGMNSTIISTSDNRVLNICSDAYQLISNESLFTPIYSELVDRFGEKMIDVKIKNVDDKKFYVTLIINNRPYNIQRGDIVNPTIQLHNSYDGTMKFRVAVGFHRVICSNGMMAFETESMQEGKHSNTGFSMQKLFNMLDNVDGQMNRFKKLSERRLTPKEVEELTEIIKVKTDFPKRLIPEVSEVIAKEMDVLGSDMNSWLLYHGFNNRLNHADIKMHPEFKAKIDVEVLSRIERFN